MVRSLKRRLGTNDIGPPGILRQRIPEKLVVQINVKWRVMQVPRVIVTFSKDTGRIKGQRMLENLSESRDLIITRVLQMIVTLPELQALLKLHHLINHNRRINL